MDDRRVSRTLDSEAGAAEDLSAVRADDGGLGRVAAAACVGVDGRAWVALGEGGRKGESGQDVGCKGGETHLGQFNECWAGLKV